MVWCLYPSVFTLMLYRKHRCLCALSISYIEAPCCFQVIFLIMMISAEGEWSFPDTLEGFGYAFNKGKRSSKLWKFWDICVDSVMIYNLWNFISYSDLVLDLRFSFYPIINWRTLQYGERTVSEFVVLLQLLDRTWIYASVP